MHMFVRYTVLVHRWVDFWHKNLQRKQAKILAWHPYFYVIHLQIHQHSSRQNQLKRKLKFSIKLPILCICCTRFWTMPTFLLKRQVLVNLPTDNLDPAVAKSIDFMVDRVNNSVYFMLLLK